jgi:hypothetical protein
MERVQELIDKLYQQHLRQEAPLQLLPTVQQLYDALLLAAQKSNTPKSEKVSVVMPSKPRVAMRSPYEETPKPAVVPPPPAPTQQAPPEPMPAPPTPLPLAPLPEPQPAVVAIEAPAQPEPQATLAPEPQQTLETPPRRDPYVLQKPGAAEVVPPPQANVPEPQPAPQANLFGAHFDVPEEAPTLQQHEPKLPPKEIHELISGPQESLNDRLKQERIELAHVLKDTPIKDLRKAIGVNDKFLFVNELFRGDEAMYERSIKTINSFHIFPEAEYWINRELKVKLGWIDQSPTVKHFYHLVRRRFS